MCIKHSEYIEEKRILSSALTLCPVFNLLPTTALTAKSNMSKWYTRP